MGEPDHIIYKAHLKMQMILRQTVFQFLQKQLVRQGDLPSLPIKGIHSLMVFHSRDSNKEIRHSHTAEQIPYFNFIKHCGTAKYIGFKTSSGLFHPLLDRCHPVPVSDQGTRDPRHAPQIVYADRFHIRPSLKQAICHGLPIPRVILHLPCVIEKITQHLYVILGFYTAPVASNQVVKQPVPAFLVRGILSALRLKVCQRAAAFLNKIVIILEVFKHGILHRQSGIHHREKQYFQYLI